MKIFIASSGKALPKAEQAQKILKSLKLDELYEPIEPILWTSDDGIRAAHTTFGELVRLTKNCHGGIFIFDKDEIVVRTNEYNEEKRFCFPNQNVILEAGLFAGALGKSNIVILRLPGVEKISDLDGVTYIPFDPDNTQVTKVTKQKLQNWIKQDLRGDRPPASRNNLLMKPRKNIHALYSLENRLGLRGDEDEMCQHITRIRLMNLAGNLLFTPESVEKAHIAEDSIPSTDVLQKILEKNHNVMVQIVLTNPELPDMNDVVNRMPNCARADRRSYIFDTWMGMGEKFFKEPVFSTAYSKNQIRCFAFDGVLPYAVFQVEFEGKYTKYNHIKIDLYSSTLGNEDERRSFVIWEDTDKENYDFFASNITQVIGNRQICRPVAPYEMQAWKAKWSAIQ